MASIRSRPMAAFGSATPPWIPLSMALSSLSHLLEYPLAHRSSLLHSWRPCSPSRGSSSTVCCSLPTFKLHGCCCVSVLALVHSTRYAHCLRRIREHTPLGMTLLSSVAWMPCCMPILLPACQLWLPHVPSSRCASVDLDFVAPSVMPSRRTGHLGPMRSPPSHVETELSLRPSRVLWMAPGRCLTPSHALAALKAAASLQAAASRPPRGKLCSRRCPLCRLRTTPPTLHAGGSARLHAPLMSLATVPSAVSLMPQASLC